jgi:hypothetical protein
MPEATTGACVEIAQSWGKFFASDRWLLRFALLVLVDLVLLVGGFVWDTTDSDPASSLPFAILAAAGFGLAIWLVLAPAAYMTRRSIAVLSRVDFGSAWRVWQYRPNLRHSH